MQAPDYDVLIAGSGVVGNTLACALLHAGLRIGLIEHQPIQPLNIQTLDSRVFAITRASERIFRNLGVWDDMAEVRVSPFRAMEVWDSSGTGHIHFDSAAIVEPVLGYIIEQAVIQNALHQRLNTLAATGNLTRFQPAHITHLTQQQGAASVTLNTEQQLSTRLVVAAEGANSPLRQLAGIPYQLKDYAQHGLVANIQTEYPHAAVARQRFLAQRGILAFLPLKDPHQVSIVWSSATTQAQHLMQLAASDFALQLSAAFEHRLGQVSLLGERAAFPLIRRHADHYVQARLALIGDAAHTIHPLAGQGVNLGLLDVACLADIILNARQQRQDFGRYTVLRRYERWRRGDNVLMQRAMDGFKLLFGETTLPIRWLRNRGLNLTNQSEWVKQLIMRQAMGLNGDLPPLARYG